MDPTDHPSNPNATRAATPASMQSPAVGHAATMHAQAASAPPAQDGAASDPLVGTVVAERYRLIERLGAGGMGAVYRGEHLSLKKRVAVKFLHREMNSNKEFVARFEREAVAAANLDHPNVVAATDFGRLPDGTLFLVMEFVDGRQLRDVVSGETRVGPVRALKILRQVAAALTRAHSLGIVHRDLKPENIVITERDGERDMVKVIDFGIARVAGSAFGSNGTALTQLGTVFGTPEYMAPEQAMGQAVDARADQYALGVIAYELLTGRRPFAAEDAIDLLRMHVGAPVPKPSSFAPEIPPAADDVLLRMLAKRPTERFDSVAEAMAALEGALGPVVGRLSNPGPAGVLGTGAHGGALPAPTGAGVYNGAIANTGAIASALGISPQNRNRNLGLALAGAGLVLMAVIIGVASVHPAGSGAGSSAQTPVGRLAERQAAYAMQPDVAQALSRLRAGDVAGAAAPLQARRNDDAHDGLAAYYLGTVYWQGRRVNDAIRQFHDALELEPQLSDDSSMTRALVAALADPDSAQQAEQVLRTPRMMHSTVAAAALADYVFATSDPTSRSTALDLVREMDAGLLPRLTHARLELRAATNCEELRAAVDVLDEIDSEVGRGEAQAVRSHLCGSIRMGDRCRSCFPHGR